MQYINLAKYDNHIYNGPFSFRKKALQMGHSYKMSIKTAISRWPMVVSAKNSPGDVPEEQPGEIWRHCDCRGDRWLCLDVFESGSWVSSRMGGTWCHCWDHNRFTFGHGDKQPTTSGFPQHWTEGQGMIVASSQFSVKMMYTWWVFKKWLGIYWRVVPHVFCTSLFFLHGAVRWWVLCPGICFVVCILCLWQPRTRFAFGAEGRLRLGHILQGKPHPHCSYHRHHHNYCYVYMYTVIIHVLWSMVISYYYCYYYYHTHDYIVWLSLFFFNIIRYY